MQLNYTLNAAKEGILCQVCMKGVWSSVHVTLYEAGKKKFVCSEKYLYVLTCFVVILLGMLRLTAI